tara:strand:- start:99 stop:755 length:657 start_codon:yes stop_codon:yes gene_type:complete
LISVDDRLIFLDIDGVLNSREHLEFRGTPEGRVLRKKLMDEHKGITGIELVMLDHALVKRFFSFVVSSGCKVIISSTWREGHTPSHFETLFALCGAEFPVGTIIGLTPMLEELNENRRGHEINQWIVENNYSGKYVVLDDGDRQFLPDQHLVKTDYSVGLTEEDIQEVRVFLHQPYEVMISLIKKLDGDVFCDIVCLVKGILEHQNDKSEKRRSAKAT